MQEKTASGVIVYLQEELGDARLRAQQLTHYIKKATELIENSEHRDHFFEVAGHLIYGIPEVAFKLGKALDAAALAAAKLDYEEIKQGLKPEKVEELEEVLNDARLRYLNRRSSMTKYKFNVPVGPTIVKEVAERLNATAGIRAEAGTSNVYGVIEAESDIEAADKINAASKIKKLITDRDIHRMVRKAIQETSMRLATVSPSDIKSQLVELFKDGLKEEGGSDALDDMQEAAHSLARSVQKAGDLVFQPMSDSVSIGVISKLAADLYDLVWCMGVAVDQSKSKKESSNMSVMNAKNAAEALTNLATEIEQTGRVPCGKLARLIAALETGQKKASDHPKKTAATFRAAAQHLLTAKNPSRVKLAANLRRILAEADMSTQAGAGEEFQKHNPSITDEQAKKIDEEHEKNKDVVKDKNQ